MTINRRRLLTGGASLAAVPCLGALGADLVAAQATKPDIPKDGVILVAQLQAKPGEEQAVKEALLAMVAPTRKEKGCLCYNLHQSKENQSEFMFYEQWASREALDTHGQTPHMQTMQQAIKGRLEKGGATFYELVG